MQVAASMLWTQLSSLQVAVELKAQGLENLEIVSAELVQFMLVNTQYDSILTLEDDTAQLKQDYKDVAATKKKLEAQDINFFEVPEARKGARGRHSGGGVSLWWHSPTAHCAMMPTASAWSLVPLSPSWISHCLISSA